jgi:histidinol-phosphate aminotransferase
VFAARNGIPYETVALCDDFTINIEQYFNVGKTIFIANPNAPTGIALSRDEIEQILIHNKDNVVVIDEAYVDFGGESCVPLIKRYDNLLVTQTFSKSRSLAGGRLGFGIGNRELIADLHTIRYSTNPYNVNSMTAAAGFGVLCDEAYTRQNCQTIVKNREYTTEALRELGFTVLDSKANFVFATTPAMSGEDLYLSLKQNGILVRHFDNPRISDFIRISIGTREQMKTLVRTVEKLLTEI